MSSVACSKSPASNHSPKSGVVEIRENDWNAYLRYSTPHHGNNDIISSYGNVQVYKRACALAYLGNRAQCNGGVGCKSQPRIFSPQFIEELAKSNSAQRFRRYPWLETLVNLLGDIERLQDGVATSGNVISLSAMK